MTKPIPRRLRIPVPVKLKAPIGLGDVIRRATTALGVKPCGGCKRRAELLNQHLVFESRKPRPSGSK